MKASYVYAIQAGNGLIKIGISKNPLARANDLQTANGDTLKLLAIWPGGRDGEIQAHSTLRAYRQRGEWFFASDDVLAYIKEKSGELFHDEKAIFRYYESHRLHWLQIRFEQAIATIFLALFIGFVGGMFYGFWFDDKINRQYCGPKNILKTEETKLDR